ncbi:MAG: HNH endonuclease [Acidobacteria bacterium]|nr:HNH endonuclease [Acidobacteriota bacterium]
MAARDRLADYFRLHPGRVLDATELAPIAGIQAWQRRIRELRAAGWPIDTSTTAANLKPGEYRLAGEPPEDYLFAKGISARVRAEVLERNGYTCQMCGAAAGETGDDGKRVRLQMGHIVDESYGGEAEARNLRALCAQCNHGAKNLVPEPPRWVWLLSQIRRARVDDQLKALEWLQRKFEGEP